MSEWEENTIMYILDMCNSLSKDSLVFLKNNIKVESQKEDKIRQYIMNRNIRYDLVGEDLLAILNDEYDDEDEEDDDE